MVCKRIEDFIGTYIGEGDFRREVKLFSSPNSLMASEHFALGMTIIGPGKRHECHAHDSNREIIVVYEGEGSADIAGDSISIRRGDIIELRENEGHAFVNTGAGNLCLLWIYFPPGLAEQKFLTCTSS